MMRACRPQRLGIRLVSGVTRVLAYNEDRDPAFPAAHRYAPYAALDFAGGAFSSLVIETLGGDDVVDVVSLAGAGALGSVSVSGGAGRDALSVAGNTPSGATVTLAGGDGDDHAAGRDAEQRAGQVGAERALAGLLRGHHGGVGRGRSRGRSAGAG